MNITPIYISDNVNFQIHLNVYYTPARFISIFYNPINQSIDRMKKISLYNLNINKKLPDNNIINNINSNNYIIYKKNNDFNIIPDIIYLSELIQNTNMIYEILTEKYMI